MADSTVSNSALIWNNSEKLKDSSNYPTWKNLVKQALLNAGAFAYVLGKGKGAKPKTKNEDEDLIDEDSEYGKWSRGNAKAYTILHRTCGQEPMRTIRSTDNAATAWQLLKDRYEGRGFFLIAQGLDQIANISYKDHENVAAFNAKFKDIKASITDAGLTMPATYYINLYLRQVAATFPTWSERQRSKLRMTDTLKLPTDKELDELMLDLLDENRALSILEDSTSNALALYGNKPQRTGTGRKLRNPNLKCTHCDKMGHTHERCFKKHPELLKSKDLDKTNPIALTACYSVTPIDMRKGEWILDTGASHHMCNDRNLFEDYIINPSKELSITTAGSNTRAEGKGSVILDVIKRDKGITRVRLENVLHMPNLAVNLISGPQLTQKGVYIDGRTRTIRFESNRSEICSFQALDTHMKILTSPISRTANALLAELNDPMNLWHHRLAHLGPENIKKTAKITTGINLEKSRGKTSNICEACELAKSIRTQSREPQRRALKAFDKVHIDVIGPINPIGINGDSWAMIITDDCTRARWIFTFKKKGDAHHRIIEFVNMVHTQYGVYPKVLRMDNGNEYGGTALNSFCSKRGIIIETTVPYTPEQDGVAERANRIILERARSISNSIPIEGFKKLWPELMRAAIYITNRVATRSNLKTPIESLSKEFGPAQIPDLSHLRIIGCKAYYHIPKERIPNSSKFEPRARIGILVGFEGNSIYRIYDEEKGVIRASAVRFDETEISPVLNLDPEGFIYMDDLIDGVDSQYDNETTPIGSIIPIDDDDDDDDQAAIDSQLHQMPGSFQRSATRFNDQDPRQSTPIPEQLIPNRNTQPLRPAIRPKRSDAARALGLQGKGSLERNYMAFDERIQAFLTEQVSVYSVHASHEPKEPTTYQQALNCPEREDWIEAMASEYNSLILNETWDELEPPPGTHILRGKWVYTIKRNAKGSIERYKARWVARGFEQLYGIDYEQTFAAVAKSMTIRIILALAAAQDYEIEQMDAVTAFLNSDLTETVWVELPPGYQKGGKACRLKRGMYGLKQAARLWAIKLRTQLQSLGYHPIPADECIYLHPHLRIYVATYVDDFLIVGPESSRIGELKAQLSNAFRMKDLGPCKYFLGIQISRDRPNRRIHLSQGTYIEKILRIFDMINSAPKSTPMETNALQNLPKNLEKALEDDIREYQSILGSLMYPMTQTRPDLAFAVTFLSRHSTNPSAAHAQAIRRVLRYLNGTRNMGITYDGRRPGFWGCSDADWAGDIDTRSSTSAYVFFLYGGPITWKSTRQKSIALSSTESEYYGLTDAAKEAIWLQSLLKDLKYENDDVKPVKILGDNQGSLALSENPEYHQRTKHIDIKYHFIRHQIAKGKIKVSYIETAKMPADGLTKPLSTAKHSLYIQQLGLESWN